MTGTLRVKAVTKQNGQRVQFLQRKAWIGWKTIDFEVVPDHALISLGCFGDTGGWVSKFTKYGDFGRDGILKKKEHTT